jgi:hypothetical protein
MKNEFIPYEQALALKGLGFDEPCFGWFDTGWLRVGCFESEYVQGLGDLPAPLYQQAFRWFREKHGLRHFIEYDNGHYNAVVQSSLVYHCDTHEEAELACLNRLIILITPITNPQTKPWT